MRSLTKWATVVLAIALSQWGLCAAAPTEPPSGIDAIRAYEGTWDINIEHFDTAHSKASHEHTLLRNDCWKSGGYFACHQYVNGDSKVLLVFTFDPGTNTYTSYQIPPGGGDSGSGKLRIEGNVWTFPWQSAEGGQITYFHVVNVFTASDRIEFRQEYSPDNVHWTVMAKGSEKKTSGK